MAYLKCFGVGVLLAFAGAVAWLSYLCFSVARSVPPELRRGGAVSIDIRTLFDNRALLVLLIFFVLGFFIEFLIVKRSLLQAR